MDEKEKKCICTADMTDWPIIPNPDCPRHGALHKHSPTVIGIDPDHEQDIYDEFDALSKGKA